MKKSEELLIYKLIRVLLKIFLLLIIAIQFSFMIPTYFVVRILEFVGLKNTAKNIVIFYGLKIWEEMNLMFEIGTDVKFYFKKTSYRGVEWGLR